MAMLQLQNSVAVMRRELQNLRKQVEQLKYMLKSEAESIRRRIIGCISQEKPKLPKVAGEATTVGASQKRPSLVSSLSEAAIGTVRTCFREKNGTPRQPGLVRGARGVVRVEKFTNPAHSLEGLENYSHAWLLFVFHLNESERVRAKVKLPRMGGEKRGVFATRSPHRPCPIGLSLVQIDRVVDDTLHISGVDLVDGTPVLDIKPYIPTYDNPTRHNMRGIGETPPCQSEESLVRVAPWLDSAATSCLEVEIREEAEHQLSLFQCHSSPNTTPRDTDDDEHHTESTTSEVVETTSERPPRLLEMFSSLSEAREAIVEVLRQDPRSVYRRERCSHEPYKFSIDNLNITCEFTEGKAVVTDIQPKGQWIYKRSAK